MTESITKLLAFEDIRDIDAIYRFFSQIYDTCDGQSTKALLKCHSGDIADVDILYIGTIAGRVLVLVFGYTKNDGECTKLDIPKMFYLSSGETFKRNNEIYRYDRLLMTPAEIKAHADLLEEKSLKNIPFPVLGISARGDNIYKIGGDCDIPTMEQFTRELYDDIVAFPRYHTLENVQIASYLYRQEIIYELTAPDLADIGTNYLPLFMFDCHVNAQESYNKIMHTYLKTDGADPFTSIPELSTSTRISDSLDSKIALLKQFRKYIGVGLQKSVNGT